MHRFERQRSVAQAQRETAQALAARADDAAQRALADDRVAMSLRYEQQLQDTLQQMQERMARELEDMERATLAFAVRGLCRVSARGATGRVFPSKVFSLERVSRVSSIYPICDRSILQRLYSSTSPV